MGKQFKYVPCEDAVTHETLRKQTMLTKAGCSKQWCTKRGTGEAPAPGARLQEGIREAASKWQWGYSGSTCNLASTG